MARILVVDDASIMRKNLKTILSEAGHTIIAEASNGSQAYVEYMKYKPDLVTMDITMPYMNGIDTLKKILEDYPDAKIIIISSTNNNKIILEAIQSGAKNYIIKPFMVDKVLDVVNQVLNLNSSVSSDTIDKIYKNIEENTTPDDFDNEEQIAFNAILPKESDEHKSSYPLAFYNVTLSNNTFNIRIESDIDKTTFKTLYDSIKGFLIVKPLKIVFDFTRVIYLNIDCIKLLVPFINKAKEVGGSVIIISSENDFISSLKNRGLDSSIEFLPNLNDVL